MKVVSFSAASGTGKTTLLEKVIPILVSRGWRVGALKHDAHAIDIDRPGKDSHRLSAAGAEIMVVAGGERLAMVRRLDAPLPPAEIVAGLFAGMDLVLLEGFGDAPYPVIIVRRKGIPPKASPPGGADDPRVVAVVSDEPLDVPVPLLDLDDPERVAGFLEKLLRD